MRVCHVCNACNVMYVCMYVYMYVYVCMCMYVLTDVCMYICMYVCVRVCMYVCMYIYICICIYIYMCICTYHISCVFYVLFLMVGTCCIICEARQTAEVVASYVDIHRCSYSYSSLATAIAISICRDVANAMSRYSFTAI